MSNVQISKQCENVTDDKLNVNPTVGGNLVIGGGGRFRFRFSFLGSFRFCLSGVLRWAKTVGSFFWMYPL